MTQQTVKTARGRRRAMFRAVRKAGFYISRDNLALLGAGGLLLNGTKAPANFLEMNGWPVEDVAAALHDGCCEEHRQGDGHSKCKNCPRTEAGRVQ